MSNNLIISHSNKAVARAVVCPFRMGSELRQKSIEKLRSVGQVIRQITSNEEGFGLC